MLCAHRFSNAVFQKPLFPHFTDRATEAQGLSCRFKKLLPDLSWLKVRLGVEGNCRGAYESLRMWGATWVVLRTSESDCPASNPSSVTF